MTPVDALHFSLRGSPAPSPFRPPPLRRVQTAGGLKIILSEYHAVPLAHFYCAFAAGAQHEPPGVEGVASMVMPLLRAGTARRGADQISREAEALGADILTYVDWDCGSLTVELLSEDLDFGVELLLELANSPSFPEPSIKSFRQRQLDLLKRQAYQPAEVADAWFARAVYGDHPYGRALPGSPSSLNSIERGHLIDFHRRHATLQSAVLVGIGSFDVEALARRLESAAPANPSPAPPSPASIERPETSDARACVVNLRGATQTEIRVGHVGVPRGHPDLARLHLLSRLLTRRLKLSLRDRLGYTYHVRSRFAGRSGPGPFVVAAAVRSDSVGAAVREITSEMERMQHGSVSETELAGARRHAAGAFVRSLQSAHEMALQLRHLALHDLPDDYFQSYLRGLHETSPGDLTDLARRHLFPRHLTVVAVGEADELRPQLSGCARLSVIDPAEH